MTQPPRPQQPPLPPPAQGGRIVIVDGTAIALTGERALTYSVAAAQDGKPVPLAAADIAALKQAEIAAAASPAEAAAEGDAP
jgi:hypothetical protein